jgi:hypothetical protein
LATPSVNSVMSATFTSFTWRSDSVTARKIARSTPRT